MSEQPTQPLPSHLQKEGTVFDNPDGYQLDFRAYETVPNYDAKVVELGRSAFNESAQPEIEQPPRSEVALRGAKLVVLDQVRDNFKLIEETKFIRGERAA